MSVNIFGQITSGAQVEQAVIAHLRDWAPTYIAEVERQFDYDVRSLPMVKSWTSSPSLDRWPEDQLPAVVCVSTGLDRAPRQDGDGLVSAIWRMGIAVVCAARTEIETHAFAKLYFAALRAILLQHPACGGFAESTEWTSEEYDALPTGGDERRSLAAAYGIFLIGVGVVGDVSAGLTEPLEDPYDPPADWPTVETTDVEVEKS
jgi:hypothetical protein